ncbi:hypothetical protein Y032_0533g3055 [Ancylostoma ceylanicum]|nr:hypothetical protein Y032_0533g3055 [Ancylostoma ceylanicum]
MNSRGVMHNGRTMITAEASTTLPAIHEHANSIHLWAVRRAVTCAVKIRKITNKTALFRVQPLIRKSYAEAVFISLHHYYSTKYLGLCTPERI